MSTRLARGRIVRALLILGVLALALELGLIAYMKASGNERGMGLHPTYGWRMLPDVARSGPMWGAARPARTNSAGWRDRERDLAPAPGTRRIAVLGDSFTFGVGVDDGERFTDQMETSGEGLEVLNFGVNGYGTDQALCVLREEALDHGPDVVVYESYLGNDLEDIAHSLRHRWPKPHFTLQAGDLVEHPPRISLGVRLRSHLYLGEAVAAAADRAGFGAHVAREDVGDPERLYLALVKRMARLSREAGARFLVMLVHEPSIDAAVYGRLRGRLESAGLEVLDLEPVFKAAEDPGLFNPPPVAHWSPAGHRLVGGVLTERIEALEPAPQPPPRRKR